jgi:hypothetical protein
VHIKKNSVGFVRQKDGRRGNLSLNERWNLLPPFLSNEPGTGIAREETISV